MSPSLFLFARVELNRLWVEARSKGPPFPFVPTVTSCRAIAWCHHYTSIPLVWAALFVLIKRRNQGVSERRASFRLVAVANKRESEETRKQILLAPIVPLERVRWKQILHSIQLNWPSMVQIHWSLVQRHSWGTELLVVAVVLVVKLQLQLQLVSILTAGHLLPLVHSDYLDQVNATRSCRLCGWLKLVKRMQYTASTYITECAHPRHIHIHTHAMH